MKIPCSNCNQRLEIPEELAGQTIECPACNASLAVPSIEVPPPATPQIRVTAPQANAPQKPATKRKIAAPPIAASPKKTKSLIPKLAIGSVVCLVIGIAILILVFNNNTKNDSENQLTRKISERRSPQTTPEPFGSFLNFSKMKSDAKILSTAIANDDLNEVKDLLANGVDPNGLPSQLRNASSPEWPLMQAVSLGYKEVMQLLIDNGVDVNKKVSFLGTTALHEAAYIHRKEIVALLIANGADINAKSNDDFKGVTPIDFANKGIGPRLRGRILSPSVLEKNRAEITDLLRKHGGKTGEELKAEGK